MLCGWADKIPILGSAREEILETIFLPFVQNLFLGRKVRQKSRLANLFKKTFVSKNKKAAYT